MDLCDANRGARWHPLTAMLTFESAAGSRFELMSGAPIIHLAYLPGYSGVIHESAHLWCARNTRLGVSLSLEAGRLLGEWRDGHHEPVTPRRSVLQLLGAMEPLLEGLALYAQLDYETEGDGSPVASPVAKVAEAFWFRMDNRDLSLPDLLRVLRGEALYPPRDRDQPLLPVLFCVPNDNTAHYFAGYLYVKALSAYLSRRLSLARDPQWFLPVAIKLLCDAPSIIDADRTPLSPRTILGRSHSTLLGVADDAWPGIDRLLRRRDVASWFNFWDVHAQLDSAQFDEPIVLDEASELEAFRPSAEGQTAFEMAMRATQMVYLHWWRRGRLGVADDGEFTLAVDDGQTMRLPLLLWSDALATGADDARGRAVAAATRYLEEKFIASMTELVDQEVTIAMFLTLSQGTAGLAVWKETDLVSVYPFVADTVLVDAEEGLWLREGLRVGPSERDAFGRSLTGREEMSSARWEATAWLLEQLTSSAQHRVDLAQRFCGPAFLDAAGEVRVWATRDPDPDAPGRRFIDSGRKVFDLPGFGEALDFADLLPALELAGL